MSWTARFVDGPCQGSADRVFGFGRIHRDLFLMPDVARGDGWILVGYDGLEPEEPWPDQVQYRFDRIDAELAEDGGALCWYRQVAA